MQRLKQKIIFITGASSGIGKACAEQFASAGAKVILTARRKARIEALAVQLQETYKVDTLAVELDVQDKQAVKACINNLPKQWQAIDVLVNNAGLALSSDVFQEAEPDDWDVMIDTNIKGVLYVSRAVVSGMLERGRGHIINISSIAGYEHYHGGNVYCATKHALRAISKSMHIDLLGQNIRVSDVAPGLVATEFSEVRWNDKQRADEFYNSVTPLQPDDIADAVVYCASRPEHVDVSQMVVMPTSQAGANHVHKPGEAPKGLFASKK
jgi:NADP-dependent 3-hydroxy acid dehydrogenase YdfG